MLHSAERVVVVSDGVVAGTSPQLAAPTVRQASAIEVPILLMTVQDTAISPDRDRTRICRPKISDRGES